MDFLNCEAISRTVIDLLKGNRARAFTSSNIDNLLVEQRDDLLFKRAAHDEIEDIDLALLPDARRPMRCSIAIGFRGTSKLNDWRQRPGAVLTA